MAAGRWTSLRLSSCCTPCATLRPIFKYTTLSLLFLPFYSFFGFLFIVPLGILLLTPLLETLSQLALLIPSFLHAFLLLVPLDYFHYTFLISIPFCARLIWYRCVTWWEGYKRMISTNSSSSSRPSRLLLARYVSGYFPSLYCPPFLSSL